MPRPSPRDASSADVHLLLCPVRAVGRTQEGGSFNAYYEALANLGSEFVRYAPCAWADLAARLHLGCAPTCMLSLPVVG